MTTTLGPTKNANNAHSQETDKAFRIGTPMRKAFWTRRFAARWGEQHAASGRDGLSQGDRRRIG